MGIRVLGNRQVSFVLTVNCFLFALCSNGDIVGNTYSVCFQMTTRFLREVGFNPV